MTMLAFCLGVLFGGVLGAIGMYLIIKETRMDLNMIEDEPANQEANNDIDFPNMEYHPENLRKTSAKEIKYGRF